MRHPLHSKHVLRALPGIVLCVCATLVARGAPLPQTSTPSPSGLQDLFELGPIFQDRNSDTVVDFVDAGIVLGDTASAAEIAAASEVAARLGFETMAMNIPVARQASGSGIGIAVGRSALPRAGVAASEVGIEALSAGEGVVALASVGDRSWVVVAGADGAGTRAAAEAFAGRLPRLWDPDGTTLAEMSDDVRSYLDERGVEAASIRVPSVTVSSGGDAYETVRVDVGLASAADLTSARQALEPLVGRAETAAEEEAPLSYPGARRLRLTLSAPGGETAVVEVLRAAYTSPRGPISGRPGSGGKENLDLSSLFTNDGLLGDSDSNEIPDRIDALLSPSSAGGEGAIDVAARLGLESAGVVIPIARAADEIDEPGQMPTLVLIGADHPLTRQLVDDGTLQLPELGPGQGLIQVVSEAFGDKAALVVTGGDAAGAARAARQLAERFPNVWARGKDRTTVDDIEYDVWRFIGGRSPAGQATIALYKLDRLIDELAGKDLQSANVLVSLEKPAAGFEALIERRAAALGADALEVTVDDRDVQNASVIFEEEFEVASEVDEFWSVFRARVLPAVRRGRPVVMQARLSEPPEVRAELAEQARAELLRAGASEAGTRVDVLMAHKSGYSWLYDVVRPQLAGETIGEITIRFAESAPPPEWPQQAMYTPVRWLKEIFPIDEILARELEIGLEQIDFEMMPPGTTPTYEVLVTSPDGTEILRDTFEPKHVLRPYYDRFDDYEMVRVATGWLRAEVDGRAVANQRIVTDYERFWDHWQAQTLPAVYDYVMERTHRGNPDADDAPFFGELTVDLTLSEPHYLLDIDKELISTLDSLHEEIYFPTLLFFRLLGQMTTGGQLDYPGRVIPIMRPKSDGRPGRAKITFTGFATSRPAVVVDYVERDGTRGQERLDIPKVTTDRPTALAALVRDGRPGLELLDLRVKVDSEADIRDELLVRYSPRQVDSSWMSAEQVVAMVGHLGELRAAGMYEDALAYNDVGTLRIAAGWEFDVDPETQRLVTLAPNGRPRPHPDVADLIPAGYRYDGGTIVQWDTPIPPPEAHELLGKMSTFPEATVYKVGESYLGKEIWAMDLMPAIEASHWSHFKATTFKPTVVYSAREHANEVSSTSHVLKLAEQLLTDPAMRSKLDRVNVVIHPITNPDGAQLAYDLYEITPELILHAGYLASLGQGPTSGSNDPMPIYPEAKVRDILWSTWLPDIFLNPHGYPSHEVVQLFSEYAGLVRRGRVTERNWSFNKGWFIPGFNLIDDPRYPHHKDAALSIRAYITEYINSSPEVHDMNQRNYDRYRRYGMEFDPEVYRMDLHDEVNIHMPLKGSRPGSGGRGGRGGGRNPRVTIWSGGTEAPDETAHGDWMKIVAQAGLNWDRAILDYLFEGNHSVDRRGSSFWGGVRLSWNRPRPPRPDDEEESASGRR